MPETLQLRPISSDFKDTLRGALAQRGAAEEAIRAAVAKGVDSEMPSRPDGARLATCRAGSHPRSFRVPVWPLLGAVSIRTAA